MSSDKRLVLVSYPRSGSHFVRYCIEYFTQMPTFGNEGPLIIPKQGKDWILYRRHFWDIMSKAEKRLLHVRPEVIFLIRDYHECVISQMKRTKHKEALRSPQKMDLLGLMGRWKDQLDIQTKFTPSSLADNLEKFHAYKGKKMVLYYEDLMDNLKGQLEKLFDFVGVEIHKDLGVFIESEKSHRNASYGHYNNIQGSLSQNKPTNFHSSILSDAQKRQMDTFYKQRLGPLYEEYLIRYRFGVSE